MNIEREAALLRVYCVAGDHVEGQPLHEAITRAARMAGLSGATVLGAKMGFSRGGAFYSDVLDETLGDHRPLVVEIVDALPCLTAFLPRLHELVQGRRLVTLERAEVVFYKPNQGAS